MVDDAGIDGILKSHLILDNHDLERVAQGVRRVAVEVWAAIDAEYVHLILLKSQASLQGVDASSMVP